jgi:hypothetical protein
MDRGSKKFHLWEGAFWMEGLRPSPLLPYEEIPISYFCILIFYLIKAAQRLAKAWE